MTHVHHARPQRPTSPVVHEVLDPCTLGRPMHLLHGFEALWKEDVAEFFVRDMNRRYRSSFDVGSVSLYRAAPIDVAATRWQLFSDAQGRMGCAFERKLLLCILGYRYGEVVTPIDESQVPETATEERLASTLALRLVTRLAQRIDAMDPKADNEPLPVRSFAPSSVPRSGVGSWILRVELRELSQLLEGVIWLTLDESWMGLLLRHITPRREVARDAAQAMEPLPSRLQLHMVARLLQKEMALGEVFDLKVGDVIPIRLGATDVLIDDSPLFTAAVVEHQGKLCLTSFESVD